jgi:hypothetical protein
MIFAALLVQTMVPLADADPWKLGNPIKIDATTTVNAGCVISARRYDTIQYTARVKWAPCEKLRIRVMSLAELNKLGQLDDIPSGFIKAVEEGERGYVITVWGAHSAAIYLPSLENEAFEIVIAD